MKHGDIEFHDLQQPLLDSIADEGLRIATSNGWNGLVIEIAAAGERLDPGSPHVRCALRPVAGDAEIDEPSAVMLEAARRLQELFMSVSTPLAGVTIDWINGEANDGMMRRRCRFRYE